MSPLRRPIQRGRRRIGASLLLALLLPSGVIAAETCFALGAGDFTPLTDCQRNAAGNLELPASGMKQLHFDAEGVAAVVVGGQHYYVRADGRSLPVLSHDNGPDYFEEGLTRARINGRIGYFNHQLQPAFAARFDWGFPFKRGLAEVCNGCSLAAPDADGHRAVVGGEWFLIDRQGQVIAPAR